MTMTKATITTEALEITRIDKPVSVKDGYHKVCYGYCVVTDDGRDGFADGHFAICPEEYTTDKDKLEELVRKDLGYAQVVVTYWDEEGEIFDVETIRVTAPIEQ